MTRTNAALAPALLLAACSPAADRRAADPAANERDGMQRSVDELALSVRLKAAEARIVQLEKQVGALEATPDKIENQLLTQRIEQLEARIYARAPRDDTTPAPPSAQQPAPAPTPLPNRFNPFGL